MSTPAVTFRVLGPFEVWRDGARLALGGRHQDRALAVLLLDAGRAVPLSRLIEAVWGDLPPSTASHQIRKVVAQLRRALPASDALIVTDGAGYRIAVCREQLDVLQYEWHLDQVRDGVADEAIGHLRDALALWRGAALSGLGGPVIDAAAVMLDESRLASLEQLAALRLARDDGADLIGPLRRLLAAHPLRETLRGHLILALYRCGRQAEALTMYDEGRRLLRDELGVDPSRELTRLYQLILHNDASLAAPAPVTETDPERPLPADTATDTDEPPASTLPYDVPDFTGRTAELSALLTFVPEAARQALTIVTIDGMAGVGKSSLAIHAAYRLADRFPDGQLFLDLQGFTTGRTPLDPSDALDLLLRSVGVAGNHIPDQLAERAAMWRAKVARRSLVLLLDNAADTAQVRALVPGAPGSLVLITSRARLTGLEGAVPLSLTPPSPTDSRALVARILGAERVAAEEDAVTELIEVCGGLPLALRVAAARLSNRPQWTIAHLVSRLRRAERGIDELSVDDRSVAAAFTMSYDGLDPEHRRLFRLLGLHPGADFAPRSAAALAGIDVARAEDVLEGLLDARHLDQRTHGRYTFHNLFRSYAQRTVRQEESAESQFAALSRLYDYGLLAMRRATAAVQPSRPQPDLVLDDEGVDLPTFADRDAAFNWLDAEQAGVVSLARAAPELGFDLHAAHLAVELGYYLQIRGQYRTMGELLAIGYAAAQRVGDELLELRCVTNLVVSHSHFGRFAEALESAQSALVLAERLGDDRARGHSLGHMGAVLRSLGQFPEALRRLEAALEIHRRLGNRQLEASVLISLSVSHDAFGRYDESMATATEALRIERELGDEWRQVIALVNIASAQTKLGDLDAAILTLDEASCTADRVTSPLAEAMITLNYAEVLRRMGRLREALEHAERAHLRLRALDRPSAMMDLLNILGDVRQDRGEYDEALAAHQEALGEARSLGVRLDIVRGLDGVARALDALGNRADARKHWFEAREQAVAMGLPVARSISQRLTPA